MTMGTREHMERIRHDTDAWLEWNRRQTVRDRWFQVYVTVMGVLVIVGMLA